jgi:predicted nucleic acid-binding protein
VILYLDTSSLLKLYLDESGTEEVQSRLQRADVVATSVIAYPESHAALARRHREGTLTKSEFKTVVEKFRDTWPRFLAVILSAPVYVRAGTLAVTHGLRGMDGIHLASCVELLGDGDRVEFLAHDLRLMRAATKELKKHKR